MTALRVASLVIYCAAVLMMALATWFGTRKAKHDKLCLWVLLASFVVFVAVWSHP